MKKPFVHKKKDKKPQTPRKPILESLRLRLDKKITLAGSSVPSVGVAKRIFRLSLLITLVLSFYVILQFLNAWGLTVTQIASRILFLWFFMFFIILILIWIIVLTYYEVQIYQRTKNLESVLSDFLQITASNIRSGMPVDRALWYAVKPRFGVLSKEIEVVAKEVMSGKELVDALDAFAKKYNSVILQQSIVLLIEGINAGGEIGELLNKVALNIKDGQIMRKEMSANVMTYVIFISFASILAAPFLFALSYNLVWVIQSIIGGMDIAPSGMGGFSIGTDTSITLGDFRVFAIVTLSVTSMMTSMIISTIRKGSAKESYRYIPWFIGTSMGLFFVASWFLGRFLQTMLF